MLALIESCVHNLQYTHRHHLGTTSLCRYKYFHAISVVTIKNFNTIVFIYDVHGSSTFPRLHSQHKERKHTRKSQF